LFGVLPSQLDPSGLGFIYSDTKLHNILSGLVPRYEQQYCSQPLTSSTRRKEKAARAQSTKGRGGERNEPNKEWIPTPTPSSILFCAGTQFPRDSIRVFDDPIKIRENRGL